MVLYQRVDPVNQVQLEGAIAQGRVRAGQRQTQGLVNGVGVERQLRRQGPEERIGIRRLVDEACGGAGRGHGGAGLVLVVDREVGRRADGVRGGVVHVGQSGRDQLVHFVGARGGQQSLRGRKQRQDFGARNRDGGLRHVGREHVAVRIDGGQQVLRGIVNFDQVGGLRGRGLHDHRHFVGGVRIAHICAVAGPKQGRTQLGQISGYAPLGIGWKRHVCNLPSVLCCFGKNAGSLDKRQIGRAS